MQKRHRSIPNDSLYIFGCTLTPGGASRGPGVRGRRGSRGDKFPGLACHRLLASLNSGLLKLHSNGETISSVKHQVVK